jgi:hypothetical protein
MSKKTYRPGASPTPQYPRLVDVSRRSVLDWGLIAVGSLWLGNAGCDRPPLVGAAEAKGAEEGSSKEMGLRGKVAISRLPDAGVADAQLPLAKKTPKAAASTANEPPLSLPPGVPPQPRLEDQDPKAAVAPPTKEAARERMKMAGKPAHPRLQAPVVPEKSDKKPDKKPDKKAEKAGKPEK